MDAQCGAGDASELADAVAIRLEELRQLLGGCNGLQRGLANADDEEPEPALPVAVGSDSLEKVVVRGAVRLEVEAEVKQRLAQHALCNQDQRHEQATQTTVAVEERVNRFELDVSQRDPLQYGS